MSTSLPLLFLTLLADRQLTPVAVSFSLEDGHPDALLALLEAPGCRALVEEFPSFVGAENACQWPSDSLLVVQEAGFRLLPDDVVHFTDGVNPTLLPRSTKWVRGNWYLAPVIKPSGSQATPRTLALELLQLVTTDGDIRDIEELFRRDPGLSYHLLRIVNSVGGGTSKKIASLAQAILILGRQQLGRWLSLMLFAAGKDDSRSAMLLARAAVRACSMELLARASGLDKSRQELAFMAGMFSLLGILFGQPLPDILKPLQISDVLVGALLRHENELGRLLRAVELSENEESSQGASAKNSDVHQLRALLEEIELSPSEFNLLTIEAHLWMLRFVRTSQGSSHG